MTSIFLLLRQFSHDPQGLNVSHKEQFKHKDIILAVAVLPAPSDSGYFWIPVFVLVRFKNAFLFYVHLIHKSLVETT
jgi:hypothetical protein